MADSTNKSSVSPVEITKEAHAVFGLCLDMAKSLREFELSTVLMTATTLGDAVDALPGGGGGDTKELEQSLAALKNNLEETRKKEITALKQLASVTEGIAGKSAGSSGSGSGSAGSADPNIISNSVIAALESFLTMLIQFSVTLQQDVNVIMQALTTAGVTRLMESSQSSSGS